MFEIRAEIVPGTTREDLLAIPAEEIEGAEYFFENADVSGNITLQVESGSFIFSDSDVVPFKDYKSKVTATYTSPDGDHWFVTSDGGHTNVSRMVRILREALADARH